MNHEAIRGLRAAVASNVSASRALAREAAALGGPEHGQARANIHLRRRRLGAATRTLLLALAFLRGAPYRKVESPRTSSKPDEHGVAAAAGADATPASVLAWLSEAEAVREAA